ncbi:Selenocysteine lyase/Cysteine desulfurase [Robiginitalea myxolifaciens]|uniref:Selenocysteine lyase/Cysteine desulfurase n=1 Tax=Robiginitalea myxolifaciens TaxID=400055 RepID=A0A1I6FSG2_9FLAO|nr:aminotransferase class V-fold PLP-dependent enzyme [Robiginitalea myxolifaciens]SFR32737.1 Selenocysteine lyase/Cysteine desulfurase [Robiginitalea myxolifaciens]
MQDFRLNFPLLQQSAYLNTPAWGLMHQEILAWRREYDEDFAMGGSRFKLEAMALLQQTRELAASLFNGDPDRTALVPNVSLGLNMLLEGLPKGAKVLLPADEYPSVDWPFAHREFAVTRVPLSGDPEGELSRAVERIQPEILMLSLVRWTDGLLISHDFLASLKADNPELLIIADATQYLGAFDCDFDSSGIDVLGASGYKWLLGGNGNGFVFLSEMAEARIAKRSAGFNSTSGDLDGLSGISLARSLEPGHLDTLNFGSLLKALQILQGLGLQQVETYVRDLSAALKAGLHERGLLSAEISGRPVHSSIFNIAYSKARHQAMREAGIVFSPRGGGIRVGVHCYNNTQDLERLFGALDSAE